MKILLYQLVVLFLLNASMVKGEDFSSIESAVKLVKNGSYLEKDNAIKYLDGVIGAEDTEALQDLRQIQAITIFKIIGAKQSGASIAPETVNLILGIGMVLAQRGVAEDQFNLANLYAEGLYGVQQDFKKAFQWFSLAAESGNLKSQIALSKMYRDGNGVMKDEFRAHKLISTVAKPGDDEAMLLLADYLEKGIGTSVDIEGSIKVLKQIQSPLAMIKIGFFYLNGSGVLQNHTEAFRWFTKAATKPENSYADRMFISHAKHLLGVMYKGGVGVKQDLVRAHMWFNLAAAQGNFESERERDDLKLSSAQIAKAQLLAKNWKPSR